jgi:serine/threonine protein kinase
VPGGALAAQLKHGPLSLTRTVEILAEVAAALDFAHQRGVLHRDVKPQNVLLDEQGHAYLADFGIARMMEGASVVTRSGVVTGTPLYMSPEQAKGEKADHRADIYALGIVAYEMVTGHVPFTADTPVAVLMKHIMDPIPLPPASQVPEPILRAILKCVAKDRADRWPSARQFVGALRVAIHGSPSALEASISDHPTRSQPTALPERPGPGRRIAALGLGGLLLALLAALYLDLEPRNAVPNAESTPAVTPTSRGASVPPTALASTPSLLAPPPTPLSTKARPRSSVPSPPLPVGTPSPPPPSQALPASEAAVPLSAGSATPVQPLGEPSPLPAPSSSAIPVREPLQDGVSFLVGRWKGRVRQMKNPFIHREIERSVSTECRRLDDPRRVFCRSDWGILEDWLVVRHDVQANKYLYEDSDGLRGEARAGGDKIVYAGNRTFDGRSIAWRLTHQARGLEAFEITMEWSRDSKDWFTIYDAAFHRSP